MKYDQWLQARHVTDAAARYAGLAQNGWAELVGEKLREAARHGPACFDRSFYVAANRFDLGFIEVTFAPEATTPASSGAPLTLMGMLPLCRGDM